MRAKLSQLHYTLGWQIYSSDILSENIPLSGFWEIRSTPKPMSVRGGINGYLNIYFYKYK